MEVNDAASAVTSIGGIIRFESSVLWVLVGIKGPSSDIESKVPVSQPPTRLAILNGAIMSMCTIPSLQLPPHAAGLPQPDVRSSARSLQTPDIDLSTSRSQARRPLDVYSLCLSAWLAPRLAYLRRRGYLEGEHQVSVRFLSGGCTSMGRDVVDGFDVGLKYLW